MKIIIKDTIIEATPDDLRQSNSLAQSFTNILRRALNGDQDSEDESEEETE